MIEPFHAPSVRGYLHRPEQQASAALLLTHGAGSNANAPLLTALAERFAEQGWLVLRCDLPFRQNRPSGPPRPGDAERDREGILLALGALRQLTAVAVYAGGHSYGGRQCSMLAADHPDAAGALLLMSYPLHPPGRPDQMRTQHLPHLNTPAFFVHGSRDTFASDDEMESTLTLIPARHSLMTIPNAGHDLGFRTKTKSDLPKRICDEFMKFVNE